MVWVAVIIVFSVLILVHETGHLIAAKKAGIRVEVFSLGMGKRLFGVRFGDTDYRMSLIPFGGYCKMAGEDPDEAEGAEDEFQSKPVGHRFWVIAAGSLTNYLFAFILFWGIFMVGVPTLSTRVGRIMKDYPAASADLRVGDRITAVNGEPVEYWDDLVGMIREESRSGEPLRLTVKRDGEEMPVPVTPDVSTVTNVFGQKIKRPVIGIAPMSEVLNVRYGPLRAALSGGRRLLTLTGMTYKGIWLILTGGMPVKTSMSGPIGIANIMGEAARLGIIPLLIVTAHINMALAVFNLLPFPVLDGGHILFLGIEKLRGRPVPVKIQETLTQIALILLVTFALFVSWNDLKRFTPLGGDENSADAGGSLTKKDGGEKP
ncbi:MAG: RIP metalloprotease RseP [Candidatus Omnitrophica bacterium]|nr:RIP metalloprotease RseP [Candidatus Omnitrophota bacterium]